MHGINGKLYVRISIFPMCGKRKQVGGLCTILMYLVISELYIEALKMCGVCINFPCPISLKYAEEKVEAMKDKLPPWQFELVAEFIGSLRDKLTKTGLHHNYLHLD